MKCPYCNKEISGTTCPECHESIPKESSYCLNCGAYLNNNPTEGDDSIGSGGSESVDFEDRIPCADGSCIGIIIDGKCNICGRRYKGKKK